MSKSIIAEGKTSTEAIENGLKELGVSKDRVEIKILEEDKKRSFYSILAPRVVKVELTIKENVKTEKTRTVQEEVKEKRKTNENKDEIEEAKQAIEVFLKEFFKNEYNYKIDIEDYAINVDINGENINYLIGYRGETINALRVVLSAIANKKSSSKVKVFLDVAGYKEKRMKTLEELAEKIANTVIKTGKAITLEPMTAYERKVIHTKLQEHSKVKTFSKGEEPYRKVVITLK